MSQPVLTIGYVAARILKSNFRLRDEGSNPLRHRHGWQTKYMYIVMMFKDGSTNIVSFRTLGAGILALGRGHIRGIIKKFVDCLYKIKTPWGTSIKFWTFLKHHILRLCRKIWYLRIIFQWIINVFVSNSMTRRHNLKIWRLINVSHEQKSLLIQMIFYLLFILLHLSTLR